MEGEPRHGEGPLYIQTDLRQCVFTAETKLFNVFILPEDAAEPRVDEEAAEGMAEPAVETETVAAATVVAPMDALLRPIARLLTGPRPEGAETVAEPIEEA